MIKLSHPFRVVSRSVRAMLLAVMLAGVAACSSPPASHPPDAAWDPYEDENRHMHAFNKAFDRKVYRPISRGYSRVVGDEVQTGILSVSQNLSIPGGIVNNVLQGNMRAATGDTYRFVVNSTIGMFGVFDPATGLNLPPASDADFGQTLHVWGVREGSYVELPFVGPSNERDAAGFVVDFFTNPLGYWIRAPESYYNTAANVSGSLTKRDRLSGVIDPVLYESADSYAQARSLYTQNRRFKLNGNTGGGYSDPYDDPNLFGPEGATDATTTE